MSKIEKFQNYMAPRIEGDLFDSVGKPILEAKLESGYMTLLGFPFKSINHRDKTLGDSPDMGEKLSIMNLANMAEDMDMQLKIVSDGYMFNHLMKVSDRTVAAYEDEVRSMIPNNRVELLNPYQFYDKKYSLSEVREKVITQFGITDEELERRILFDKDVNELYKGMIRFMHDDLAIWNYSSGNQLHKAAKKMAREMMHWNEAYSALIKTELTEPLGAVRLSMHPSLNSGQKFSINLINAESHQSPWHSCIVIKDGNPITMKRKDAEANGYTLILKDNKPYYYEA